MQKLCCLLTVNKLSVLVDPAPVQPSAEYPVILFSELDYNNNSVSGHYHRLKEEDFRVWGRTVTDQKREFVYRSLLIMPNRTLTFKGIGIDLINHNWF